MATSVISCGTGPERLPRWLWCRLTSGAYAFVVFLALVSSVGPGSAQQEDPTATGFGGSYSSLKPAQQRLVDDWFGRFSAAIAKTVDPAEGYDKLPLSTKTTFNAVTHALLKTKLSDQSGNSLSESSMDLVDKVDGVAGAILGTRGDQQFRIYVQMKPGALALLARTREFERGPDNAVYHHGYPTNFRTPGTPSLQFSLTRDGTRADVDVDYRSSRFPVFLVNGHLSASNSDVRASDNDVRHNTQWAGLPNWWRNLLGLPLLDKETHVDTGRSVIASEPKLKADKPKDSVYDFLNTWLVEQKPNESIAYFAEESFPCMEVENAKKTDRGVARITMLQQMMAVNKRVGKISSLADASAGVAFEGERLKLIEQPHASEFSLYEVREDLAEQFRCIHRLDTSLISPKAIKSKDFHKYVGAVFRISTKQDPGRVIATLWRKEDHYWRIISYDIDPEIDRSRAPNLGAPAAPDSPVQYSTGDKGMTKSASDFLRRWLVKKDIDKAMEYVDTECLACVKIYADEGVKAPSTPQETRELLKQGMARTASAVGPIQSLDKAIIAAEPHHQDIKLVKHADAEAFAIASIPESMGLASDCERRRPNGEPAFSEGAAGAYGKYYATGFSLGQGNTSPSVLWIVWASKNGAWKAVSYLLIEP